MTVATFCNATPAQQERVSRQNCLGSLTDQLRATLFTEPGFTSGGWNAAFFGEKRRINLCRFNSSACCDKSRVKSPRKMGSLCAADNFLWLPFVAARSLVKRSLHEQCPGLGVCDRSFCLRV